MSLSVHSLSFRFLNWCPGALGFFLRQKCFPYYFNKCGKKVVFGRFLNIDNPKNISIESRCVIADRVTLHAEQPSLTNQGIIIGYGAFIGVGTKIKSGFSSVHIDAGVSIGSNCVIDAENKVHVEEKALLAAYCRLGGVGKKENEKNNKGIILGGGSWLGARTHVHEGVRVGKGCVVGAHGDVDQDLPDFIVGIGKPVRIVRSRREVNKEGE